MLNYFHLLVVLLHSIKTVLHFQWLTKKIRIPVSQTPTLASSKLLATSPTASHRKQDKDLFSAHGEFRLFLVKVFLLH